MKSAVEGLAREVATREDLQRALKLPDLPEHARVAVSYTHLTLPTNREV